MKRKVLCLIVALSFVLCGVSFAGDNDQNPTSTIVGADQLVNNRYQYVDPQDKNTQAPESVQKLLDSGVITAVQDGQNNSVVVVPGNQK